MVMGCSSRYMGDEEAMTVRTSQANEMIISEESNIGDERKLSIVHTSHHSNSPVHLANR